MIELFYFGYKSNITFLEWKGEFIEYLLFNNLVGKNLKGREYSDYIAFVAIPDMGFTYGKIEYYSDGNLIATGEITP